MDMTHNIGETARAANGPDRCLLSGDDSIIPVSNCRGERRSPFSGQSSTVAVVARGRAPLAPTVAATESIHLRPHDVAEWPTGKHGVEGIAGGQGEAGRAVDQARQARGADVDHVGCGDAVVHPDAVGALQPHLRADLQIGEKPEAGVAMTADDGKAGFAWRRAAVEMAGPE